jgi:hypothetical protein
VTGSVIAIQTFGDLLGYNPHLHVLISDVCFHKSGMLTVAPVALMAKVGGRFSDYGLRKMKGILLIHALDRYSITMTFLSTLRSNFVLSLVNQAAWYSPNSPIPI